jgi:ABC-2 type transport system permease protein
MNAFVAITKSVVRTARRERTALFFTLLLPIFFMGLFGLLFGRSQNALNIGVVDADHSRASAALVTALRSQKGLDVETGSRAHELDRLNHDDVLVVTVIPAGFGAQVRAAAGNGRGETSAGGPAAVTTYQDRNQPTLAPIAQSAVNQIVGAEAQRLSGQTPPVVIHSSAVNTRNVTTLDFYLPSMIAYIILLAGIQSVAIALVDLRERKALRRFLATPLRPLQILGGQITGRAATVLLQVLVLIAVGLFIFKVHVVGSWLLAALAILIGIACFISIGFLLTGFARTSETARGIASAIGFPMMFLSGVFVPISQLPSGLQSAVHILPLTYLTDALHQVLNDGSGLTAIGADLLVMLAWAVVCFTIAVRRFQWE